MLRRIYKEIIKYETIIIHRHQRPDGDALGSQFGLKELLITKFPEKKIMIIGEKEEFSNNSIKNIFKDEFDEVSIEDYKGALVIVVDTANVERIKGNDFFRAETVIKIDHHKSSEEFGNLEFVDDEASSTSEIISKFAILNKLLINEKAANFLMTGIVTDSGRFSYNSVSSNTFIEASNLSLAGAKISKITNKLNDRNLNLIRLQGQIMLDLKFSKGVSSYMMPKNMHKKFNVDYETSSSLIFLLMSFAEADYALFATYDSQNDEYKASLRSRKKPINQIAEKYRGGGHEMASGLKIKDKKEFQKILNELEELNNKK